MLFQIGLTFKVDDKLPPERIVLHDALESMVAIVVQAPTLEMAEHYADRIRLALQEAGS